MIATEIEPIIKELVAEVCSSSGIAVGADAKGVMETLTNMFLNNVTAYLESKNKKEPYTKDDITKAFEAVAEALM